MREPILTYKYRLKDKRAKKALAAYAFAVNQVWNYCNAYQKRLEDDYLAGMQRGKWPTQFDLNKRTSGTSKELGLHADSINETCRQFVVSRNKVKRSLRFRASAGPRRSLGWVPFHGRTIRVNGNAITYLGKKFRLFGVKDRPIPGKIRNGSFVQDARGRWYVCLTAEAPNLPTGSGEIGIDLGLKTLATMSDGSTIPALQHYRHYERRLATAQRARNKRRVKAIHAKIANVRRDQMHKATTKIAADNKLIVIGNVSSSALAKTRMAKSIFDAGWYQLKTQLAYKASRHRAAFIVVDENFTSRSCSECGSISGPKGIAGIGMRVWQCSDCGSSHDRDVNAARNILKLGVSAHARVDDSIGRVA